MSVPKKGMVVVWDEERYGEETSFYTPRLMADEDLRKGGHVHDRQ